MFDVGVILDGRFVYEKVQKRSGRKGKEKVKTSNAPSRGVRFRLKCLLYISLTSPHITRQEMPANVFMWKPIHLVFSPADRQSTAFFLEREGSSVRIIIGTSDGRILVLKRSIPEDDFWKVLPWTRLANEYVIREEEEEEDIYEEIQAIKSTDAISSIIGNKQLYALSQNNRIMVFNSIVKIREGYSECDCIMVSKLCGT